MANNQAYQSDPNDIPGGLQKFLNPGVESGLGALLQILGSYEAARRVPSGVPLQILGGFAGQNAANRQAWHQGQANNAARLNVLAGEGLIPQEDLQGPTSESFYKNLAAMDPNAEGQELSEVASLEADRQKTLATKNKPIFKQNKATGKVFAEFPETGKFEEHPELSGLAPAKSEQARFFQDHADDPDAAQHWETFKNRSAEEKYQANLAYANQERMRMAEPMARAHFLGTWKAREEQPVQATPGLANAVIIDRKTGQAVTLKNAKQLFDNPDKYTAIDRSSARTVLPALYDTHDNLLRLAAESAAILPPGQKGWIKNWINTHVNEWGISYRAAAGGVTEAQFMADRQALTAQLQRVFTGSTRQMNMVEFNSILGRAVKGGDDGRFPAVTDIESVLPARGDTREQAKSKLDAIGALIDRQMSLNNLAPKALNEAIDETWKSVPPSAVVPYNDTETPEPTAPADSEEF